MSKASPHLGYGKLPYNLPWPALIEGIFNPYNTVQVVETDKDDEVADAETADEHEKSPTDCAICWLVEAVAGKDTGAEAEKRRNKEKYKGNISNLILWKCRSSSLPKLLKPTKMKELKPPDCQTVQTV